MTDRIGVCRGCGSKFKIPDSFQGTQAKCKKCGDVVKIGAVGASIPPADPAGSEGAGARSSGHARAGAGAGRGSRAGRGRTAGGTRTNRAGGRGRAGAADEGGARHGGAGRGRRGGAEKKDNTMLFVIIGAAVVVLAVVGFMVLGGKDETPQNVADATAQPAATDVEPAIDPSESDLEPMEAAEPEPEPEPEPEKPAEPEPEEPSITNPVLSFEPFGKFPEVDDAEWETIQGAVRTYYLESPTRKKANEAKRVLDDVDTKQIPALINALNGLNINNANDFPKAANVVIAIQDTSQGLINIPFKIDASDMEANVTDNIKCIDSLVSYWRKIDGDAEKVAKFLERVDTKRASSGGEDDEG